MSDRVLVACMGNLLRADDGFGVEVARRLSAREDMPRGVRVVEAGIGGIPLVQELMDSYGCLILVDAVRGGRPPGTVTTMVPAVPDLRGEPWEAVGDLVGDPHTTTPSRVLLLARALGVLPDHVAIVGCEPLDADAVRVGLSEPVAAAVEVATERVTALARTWLRAGHLGSSAAAAPVEAP